MEVELGYLIEHLHFSLSFAKAKLLAMENPQLQATEPIPQFKSNAFLGTEGVYMLPHHIKEIDRLRRQHRFMKSTTDGALVVTPLQSEGKTLRVLDSGCADGLSPCPFNPSLFVGIRWFVRLLSCSRPKQSLFQWMR